MANEKNLIPGGHKLTLEEQKMGGIKSGEARRLKKQMKQVLIEALEEKSAKNNNMTYAQLITMGLIKGAIEGNARNYETIITMIGERPDTPIETEKPTLQIEIVDNEELEKVMYENKQ